MAEKFDISNIRYIAVGAVVAIEEEIERAAMKLVEKGKSLTPEGRKKMASAKKGLVSKGDEFSTVVAKTVQRALENTGIVTRADLDGIEKRVTEIEKKASKRPRPSKAARPVEPEEEKAPAKKPAKAATKKKAAKPARKKPAGGKPAAKKTTAKKPAAKRPAAKKPATGKTSAKKPPVTKAVGTPSSAPAPEIRPEFEPPQLKAVASLIDETKPSTEQVLPAAAGAMGAELPPVRIEPISELIPKRPQD